MKRTYTVSKDEKSGLWYAQKNEYIAEFYKRYNRLPTAAELARFILFNK